MASIKLDDAMILPHAANLDGSNFRKGQVGLRAVAGSVEGEMQHPARRLDRRERPRMRLAEDGRAQGMRGKPRTITISD
jgi:hypothetical protein